MARKPQHQALGGAQDVADSSDGSTARLTSSIPVRFPEAMLEQMRTRAEEDHRTISSWIRHIVQRELEAGPDALTGPRARRNGSL